MAPINPTVPETDASWMRALTLPRQREGEEQLSLDALASASTPWAGLAAEHGFADQAHLVREVRALAGVTPSALVRERTSGLFNTRREASAIHDAR